MQDSRTQGTRDSSGKAGEDADVIHRICCPSGLFSSIVLVVITLSLQRLEKIVTLSRVIGIITREFYTMEIGFTLSRCSINKGDIIEVRLYLQTSKLIPKRLDIFDVIQQIIAILHLAHDKLTANEIDVRQTLRLVNVAKSFSHLQRSLATLDVRKLRSNDGHQSSKLRPMMKMTFLMYLWYSFNTFGFIMEDGVFLDPSIMFQRSMDANNILILNFQRLKFPSLNYE